MLLLKNNPVAEDLKSSYIKIEELIREMKEKKLTGFIEVQLKKDKDVLLYESGKVVKVLRINSDVQVIDKDSVVIDLVKKSAKFSVYRMKASVVRMVLDSVENDPVYSHLSTDFVDMRRLLRKLQEDEFNGTVYALWEDETEGAILLSDGLPSSSVYRSSGFIEEGAEALEEIIRNAGGKNAILTVYPGKKQ